MWILAYSYNYVHNDYDPHFNVRVFLSRLDAIKFITNFKATYKNSMRVGDYKIKKCEVDTSIDLYNESDNLVSINSRDHYNEDDHFHH
jgi:hypothetical protein